MSTKVKTEVIDNYRKQNKLTVHQFCRKCNISENAYYKFMKSQFSKIRISVVYNIAVTLNMHCEDLIDDDD